MEELGVFGCDALFLVEGFATFRRKVVPSSSRVKQSKTFTWNLFQNSSVGVYDAIIFTKCPFL